MVADERNRGRFASKGVICFRDGCFEAEVRATQRDIASEKLSARSFKNSLLSSRSETTFDKYSKLACHSLS